MNYLNIELQGIDKTGKTNKYKISDFKDKNLIVYFYPQDDTPVCTQEANDFKESINEIEKYLLNHYEVGNEIQNEWVDDILDKLKELKENK